MSICAKPGVQNDLRSFGEEMGFNQFQSNKYAIVFIIPLAIIPEIKRKNRYAVFV